MGDLQIFSGTERDQESQWNFGGRTNEPGSGNHEGREQVATLEGVSK